MNFKKAGEHAMASECGGYTISRAYVSSIKKYAAWYVRDKIEHCILITEHWDEAVAACEKHKAERAK